VLPIELGAMAATDGWNQVQGPRTTHVHWTVAQLPILSPTGMSRPCVVERPQYSWARPRHSALTGCPPCTDYFSPSHLG
jgi:hypothetical protein